MLNPKVGVFYITFLPQFIPAGVEVVSYSLLLAVIHVLLSLLWFATLIAATLPLGRILQRPATIKVMDRMTGGVFIAFGTKLAFANA
jgi:threonine/homoserine/homoserine lactone efflux protein